MNTQQTKEWLERCLQDDSLFDHERQLLRVMIEQLPEEEELPPKHFVDIQKPYDENQFNVVTDFILTSKKKKLAGKDLENFLKFWNAFDYKQGRAEAAQAWIDIPDAKTPEFIELIVYAAKRTASERKTGVTPKMAQGWLTARRWENYQEQFEKRSNPEDIWFALRGSPMPEHYWRNNWPERWGPNPWEHVNELIPVDIHQQCKDWNWK